MEIFTLDFWKGLFNDLTEFLTDLPVQVVKSVLSAIAGLIESITPPEFLNHSLGDSLGPAMGNVGYFLAQVGMPEAMGILAAGLAFRLLRKVLTLGQW
tara:strand:- start:1151 stop:1444 length:294 start_codon:yes stop_codon:yes gene_type:complete